MARPMIYVINKNQFSLSSTWGPLPLPPPSQARPDRKTYAPVCFAPSYKRLSTFGAMVVPTAKTSCRYRKPTTTNVKSVCNTDVPFPFWKIEIFPPQKKQMKGSPDRIQACTTTHFDGTISVIDPEKSWVARWQRTSASFFFSFLF